MQITPGGYSHTIPIRLCAAQQDRDFGAPELERGIHLRDVSYITEEENKEDLNCHESFCYRLLSYFFVKKYLLVGASGMLWTGQWVSE